MEEQKKKMRRIEDAPHKRGDETLEMGRGNRRRRVTSSSPQSVKSAEKANAQQTRDGSHLKGQAAQHATNSSARRPRMPETVSTRRSSSAPLTGETRKKKRSRSTPMNEQKTVSRTQQKGKKAGVLVSALAILLGNRKAALVTVSACALFLVGGGVFGLRALASSGEGAPKSNINSLSDGSVLTQTPQSFVFENLPQINQKSAGQENTRLLSSVVSKVEPESAPPMVLTADADGKQLQPELQTRISAAKEYNDDTVGWIRIRGTNINFAVVQNRNDNNYYTNLGYDKKRSAYSGRNNKAYKNYGVIWAAAGNALDSRATLSDNTVLFGHNWDNITNPRIGQETDIMFEQIAGYHYTDYAKDHQYINFSIDGEDMTWVVVSAFYTEDYWKKSGISFDYFDENMTSADKQTFINEIQARSQFTTDDVVSVDDNFLTISTCTRVKGRTDAQRFVVVARLVREDEEELPTPTYEDNQKPKAPRL